MRRRRKRNSPHSAMDQLDMRVPIRSLVTSGQTPEDWRRVWEREINAALGIRW